MISGFAENTLILTDKGYKKISDVSCTDLVMSHDSCYHAIESWSYRGEHPVYKIRSAGTIDITVTANQPFLVKEKIYKDRRIAFSAPKWVTASEIAQKPNSSYYIASPINRNSKIPQWEGVELALNKTTFKLQNTLDMNDPLLWYLVGRYLGDGWLRKQYKKSFNRNSITGVIICCGKHKTEAFANIIGNSYKYTISHERTADRFVFCSTEMAHFFSQFGEYCSEKYLPGFVYDLPDHLLCEIIKGYMDSDGHKYPEFWNNITSINTKLLYSIAHCIEKVNKVPCRLRNQKYEHYSTIEGRLVHSSPSYVLTFPDMILPKIKSFYDNGCFWYPVKKAELCSKEKVFNIKVADSFPFIANHCTTCGNNS